MKNCIMLLSAILISGCSLMNPGYISTKPDIEKLTLSKSTLEDVETTLGTPAISHFDFGQEITYKYFYNTPDASVDTGLMIKGNYSQGCKDCGQIITTFAWKKDIKDFKQFPLRGLSVSDKQIDAELYTAYKLLGERQFSKAYPIVLQAAQKHSSAGEHTLGLMYINGDGVEKDYSKAAYWFARAAGANYPPALYDLGAIYRNGEGVAIDISMATSLYTRAANVGHLQAMIELKKIYVALQDQQQVDYWTKKYEESTRNKGIK